MAIVLPCTMTVHAYAAARRDVEVPRPDCPTCSAPMSFWGYYSRPVRVGEELLGAFAPRFPPFFTTLS